MATGVNVLNCVKNVNFMLLVMQAFVFTCNGKCLCVDLYR